VSGKSLPNKSSLPKRSFLFWEMGLNSGEGLLTGDSGMM